MDADTKIAIKHLAEKTGLREGTVLDLLRSGWQYTETLDQPPHWHMPMNKNRWQEHTQIKLVKSNG